jgi:hypothetical protein
VEQDETPTIVFIDDNQEELKPLAESVAKRGMQGCKVDSPEDVDFDLLHSADLVIVDYTLDRWINSVGVSNLSQIPPNGVALASVLREHYRKPALKHAPPTGFALITGDPGNLCSTPGERRPHIVARLSNLEWYFEKQADHEQNVQRIVSLAVAIRKLPPMLSAEMVGLDKLMELLEVPKSDILFERYSDSVSRCRPPIHHLSKESGGMVLIRWLLHRILPHTCFLLDRYALASRLRVSPESLEAELKTNTSFSQLLEPYRYKGLLSDFDGPRWWRGGIEQVLWEITDGNSTNTESLQNCLQKLNLSSLSFVDLTRPVVTLNADFQPESNLSNLSDTIALHLDDWPSYAEPAYMRRDVLNQNPDLEFCVAREAAWN